MGLNSPMYYKIELPTLPWSEELPFKSNSFLSGHPYEVPVDAPIAYRKAVEKIGYFFRREFEFDGPPYHHDELDKNSVVFLWIEPTMIETIKRSGEVDIIDKARFGDFYIDNPNGAMKAFLKKQKTVFAFR